MEKRNVMKELLDIYKKMFKFEKKHNEYIKKVRKYWELSEEKLNKIQGDYRSNAYNTLSFFSQSNTPMSVKFHDRLINELTDNERKILGYKK